jgi:hypothetical protein
MAATSRTQCKPSSNTPGGVRLIFHGTLANSFDSDYEMYYGSDAAVMLRENKAWMFKEVDSRFSAGKSTPARIFLQESGIALVANATKLVAQGEKPVEEAPFTNTPSLLRAGGVPHECE